MKFLSPEVALYLYKSTIRPCMENCCHVSAGAPSCYLICWISYKSEHAGLLVLYLLSVLNPWLVVEMQPALSLFCRYYFGRCSSELAELVSLPYSGGRSTPYSDRLHDFLSPFLDVTSMSMSIVSLLAQLGSGIFCLQNAFL